MRRKIGLMAAICCAWFAVRANAAQPSVPTGPTEVPRAMPAVSLTAIPGQPVIIQGPVTITANSAPAPEPKKPRIGGRLTNFVGSFFTPEHRREPDGCPTPVGCGNVYSEFKFVFGSCRQFFGTGDASQGCLRKTTVPPPNNR